MAGRGNQRGVIVVAAFAIVAVAVVAVLVLASLGSGVGTGKAGAQERVHEVSSVRSPAADATMAASSTAAPSVVATPSPAEAAARGPRKTARPVPLDASTTPLSGIHATLASVSRSTAKGRLPGETSGPVEKVVVEIANDSSRALDLSSAVVNAYLGRDETPAMAVDSAATPFPGEVGRGGHASGTFLFRVPAGDVGRFRVELDLGAGSTVALFQARQLSAKG